jgi:ribosomal-protein-alanine N-acetyltransferase
MTAKQSPAVELTAMRWWDIPEVHQLERQLFEHDPWTVPQFWSELAGSPQTRDYVLARDDAGTIVGYAGLFTSGADACVQTIAVAREAQGAGVGRLLLERLRELAGNRGARSLGLEVRADNEVALQLYRRSGFVADGRRRGYYGPGVDAVLMSCRLDGTDDR